MSILSSYSLSGRVPKPATPVSPGNPPMPPPMTRVLAILSIMLTFLRILPCGESGSPLAAFSFHISMALNSVSSADSNCSGSHTTTPPAAAPPLLPSVARVIGFLVSTIFKPDNGDALWCLKYSLLSSSRRRPSVASSGHGPPSNPAQLTSGIEALELRRFCWTFGSMRSFTPLLSILGDDPQGDFDGEIGTFPVLLGLISESPVAVSAFFASAASYSCI
nr:hypothetical protein Iba_chr12dCG13650 [Ipomoea batatas]